jgi:hypothetical protein
MMMVRAIKDATLADWVKTIRELGFPIVMALLLWWEWHENNAKMWQAMDALTEVTKQQAEQHGTQINLLQAIQRGIDNKPKG